MNQVNILIQMTMITAATAVIRVILKVKARMKKEEDLR